MLERVGVYCGSSDDVDPSYLRAARQAGRALAGNGVTIIYGGGGTGMMGALADGALGAHGQVVGIIPRRFNNAELAHLGLSELRVVIKISIFWRLSFSARVACCARFLVRVA